MATTQEVQQKLSNGSVYFYSWDDEKGKTWWIARLLPDESEGGKQPTPEQALSALIRELTK